MFFRNDATCLPALLRALSNLLTMPQHWNKDLGKSGQSEAHWLHDCEGCRANLPLQKGGYIAAEWLHMVDAKPKRDLVVWPIAESNFVDLLGDLRGITFEVAFPRTGSPKMRSIKPTSRPAPADLPEAFDLIAHLTRRYRRTMDIFPPPLPDELPHEWMARVKADMLAKVKARQTTIPGMEPVDAPTPTPLPAAGQQSQTMTPEQIAELRKLFPSAAKKLFGEGDQK